MADIAVEAFRDDIDNLTEKLMAVVRESVWTLPTIDRSIIVATALGNVACIVDLAEGHREVRA